VAGAVLLLLDRGGDLAAEGLRDGVQVVADGVPAVSHDDHEVVRSEAGGGSDRVFDQGSARYRV
jgi:hypothetical protein